MELLPYIVSTIVQDNGNTEFLVDAHQKLRADFDDPIHALVGNVLLFNSPRILVYGALSIEHGRDTLYGMIRIMNFIFAKTNSVFYYKFRST